MVRCHAIAYHYSLNINYSYLLASSGRSTRENLTTPKNSKRIAKQRTVIIQQSKQTNIAYYYYYYYCCCCCYYYYYYYY